MAVRGDCADPVFSSHDADASDGGAPPLLFLHIPKTAGTSLRRFLADQYRPDDILPADGWRQVAASHLDPRRYALAAGHFRYNFRALVRQDAQVLVTFREPSARFISELRHARRDPQFDPDHERLRDMPIVDIIRDPALSARRGRMQTSWLAACADAAMVSAYLAATPGGDPADVEATTSPDLLLRRAMAHLETVEFIGFAEDLPAVMDELCASLRFHPPARLPVDNAARADDAETQALRPDDHAIIRRLTELDRELYAFAWRLSRQRRLRGSVFDVAAVGAGPVTVCRNELEVAFGVQRRFTRDDLRSRGMIRGWSRPEDGHTWNDGPELAFALAAPAPARAAILELAGSAYIRAGSPAQDIVVHANGLRVLARRLTSADEVALTIALAAEWWHSDGRQARLRLVIELPNSVRPCDLGDGQDERQIGFAFHALRLLEAGD